MTVQEAIEKCAQVVEGFSIYKGAVKLEDIAKAVRQISK